MTGGADANGDTDEVEDEDATEFLTYESGPGTELVTTTVEGRVEGSFC